MAAYCYARAERLLEEAEWRLDNYPVGSWGWEFAELSLAFARVWPEIGRAFDVK